jgi:hypothetical protein
MSGIPQSSFRVSLQNGTFLVNVLGGEAVQAPLAPLSQVLPLAASCHSKFRFMYTVVSLCRERRHSTTTTTQTAFTGARQDATFSVRIVGHQGSPGTVRVESAGTVNRRQA